jgi:hypothetical protein
MRDCDEVMMPYETAIINEQMWESFYENCFLDEVFEFHSKLIESDFITSISTKGTWIFKPYDLRTRIF